MFLGFVHLRALGRRRSRVLFFICGVLLLLSADLGVKAFMEYTLIKPHTPGATYREQGYRMARLDGEMVWIREITVIPNFWSFTYTRNRDIGFSILRFLDRFMRPGAKAVLLKLLQLCAVLFAVFYLYSIDFAYLLPFTLIIAGGLGNSLDRLVRGYVVDYVRWYIPDSGIPLVERWFNPWPIFNLADTCITVGAGLLIVAMIIEWIQKRRNPGEGVSQGG